MNKLCDYGCGQEAKHQFKNGKWCCSENWQQCLGQKNKLSMVHKNISNETRIKMSESGKGRIVWNKGITHSLETIKKMKISHKKENLSEKTLKKLSVCNSMEKNNSWKGGYSLKNIPMYDSYSYKLSYAEEVRRNKNDKNILEVECTYCGKWFIPTLNDVVSRVRCLIGTQSGESRFYCSDKCKSECSIYRQQYYSKYFKTSTSREVQPELRQMRFEVDNYTCQKCDKHQDELDVGLHCHHLEGIRWEPLESADVDKCITLCKNCHIEVHKKEGCGYNDMRCKNDNII